MSLLKIIKFQARWRLTQAICFGLTKSKSLKIIQTVAKPCVEPPWWNTEMARLLQLCAFLLFLTLFTVECKPQGERDWGLRRRGWSWANWYYYWYWRHGVWKAVSDQDTICQRLWNVDVNRLHRGVQYDFLLQAKVSLKPSTQDQSNRALFFYLRMDEIRRKPTFRTFLDLLPNFEPSSEEFGRLNAEVEAIQENIDKFLTEVLNTRVFQELYWFLVRNDLVLPNKAKFKDDLFRVWFNNKNITQEQLSGFQKIFVGETVFNPRKVSFRNWLQFFNLELTTKLNYYGYVRFLRNDPMIISPMFSWEKGTAVSDNMFVGSTPEFELALYTLCFYVSPGKDCQCKLNTRRIMVKTVTSADGTTLKNADFDVQT